MNKDSLDLKEYIESVIKDKLTEEECQILDDSFKEIPKNPKIIEAKLLPQKIVKE